MKRTTISIALALFLLGLSLGPSLAQDKGDDEVVVTGSAVTLPTSVEVLMYPAGTWIKGTADVISLDAVYDSVGLESNTYTGIFVEEGALAVQKCTHTQKVTIDLCVSGQTAAADLTACLTAGA